MPGVPKTAVVEEEEATNAFGDDGATKAVTVGNADARAMVDSESFIFYYVCIGAMYEGAIAVCYQVLIMLYSSSVVIHNQRSDIIDE